MAAMASSSLTRRSTSRMRAVDEVSTVRIEPPGDRACTSLVDYFLQIIIKFKQDMKFIKTGST